MKNKQRRLWHLLVMAGMVTLWITQPGIGLVVSEIMYHPTDAGGTLEFIELYNDRAVFEGDYQIVDDEPVQRDLPFLPLRRRLAGIRWFLK